MRPRAGFFSVACFLSVFFFNDTATTEIYTLSLHDALPINRGAGESLVECPCPKHQLFDRIDRKSTRLNSSHLVISYAVFCLKKKKIYELVYPTGRSREKGIRDRQEARLR